VFCQPPNVDYAVINGKVVVEHGRIATIDLPAILERHNQISLRMVRGD